MSTTPKGVSSSHVSTSGGSHFHRGRHRLRNFLLPDGREVHIALSPEEAETLRQRLTAISKDEAFDLVISGSPEHLEALTRAHTHHEQQRDELKAKHGAVYDEFERLRAELDALGSELHLLTDHAVALDASFSKYGYSAHLRTYDDTPKGGSSASSVVDSKGHEKKDWEAEKRNGRVMKIYKKPTVRQYFHKGLLWRASETTEVASFELFVDLLYVGILAINGDHAAEFPTGKELLRFTITFTMGWKIWSDLALIISWFETDDIMQRISVIVVMTCLLGLTTNMLDAFNETYTMLVAFYLAASLFMGSYYASLAIVLPMIRPMMLAHLVLTIFTAILWVGSIYVEMPKRLALIFVALLFELCGPLMVVIVIRRANVVSERWHAWLNKTFEFYPAINIEHRTERTNAFVTLVFGYSVVAIIYQNAAHFGFNAFFGKAVLGLIQAFVFNWIYFELDGADLYTHAIRRSVWSSMAWGAAHLPFIMSFVLAAAALSKLVLATDCANAPVESLMENYISKSEPEVPIGLRWFYCAGLGIALLCMTIISIAHVHKDASGRRCRLSKKNRMLNRFGVCIILFCLPTAHNLDSLQLISITTGLVTWILVLELWGISCPDESFFGQKQQCQYTARCRKKDLEDGKVLQFTNIGEKPQKAITLV